MTDTGPIPPPDPAAPGNPVPPAGVHTPGAPVDYGTAPIAGGPYLGPAPTNDDKTMAMLSHLLGILIGFLGPLIIWLIKKDQSPFVNDQGKEALNFQLTLMIGYLVAGLTTCIFIGFIILPVVWVLSIIFGIMGAIKANSGVAYRYPFNIRFIK